MKQFKRAALFSNKSWCLIITFAFTILSLLSCSKRPGKPKILVFSKTTVYHHTSIANGIAAIQKLGVENGFDVDSTTDASYFSDDSLKKYSAVVFMSTTGDVLNADEEVAFERYIQAGGGYVGIHSATDTEYDWGWYGRLVGAYFTEHPDQQEAVLNIVDTNNIATKHLPRQWKRKDEWYNFKKISPDIHVLITIDEKSYKGGTNGNFHPMSWYHEYDGGRSFYTELGHTEESYTDPLYVKHLLGGIEYAIGENKKLDYAKAKSEPIPEENRFVKTTLVQGEFFEPTEMAILPDLDVLIAQRRGEILLYSDKTKKVKQAGFLNVYYKTLHTPGVNAEEGVLGLTADPDFKNNHFVYVYYSPADTSVNRLSRFTFNNDTLDPRTEKVILQLYSQREICCHTGGSLAFGADNNLFLSTGDNSTPFDETNVKYVSHGFAPLNDIPGHQQFDARRSAGNSNDLRGKILRVKINADGTYSIPEGNLFRKNEPKARPEIYVMGDRNPYRITVDKKTGYLYWGEVGPDANNDSLDTRGPRGYDEVNQARKAGYFGWPLFIANNIPYRTYDYATGKSGDLFNPEKPVNNSRNNTGLQELPPAQPAFIWYPYAASKDFPEVGTGGRNAMAGPVYYTDNYPKETRYPDYFNGKLFIYEWMRDWVKIVTMQSNGDFDKMDPFMEHDPLNSCIDMEAGPDGRIYLLEYGKGWFTKNPDAALKRIDYISGNRPPKVDSLVVDKQSGNLPLTISAKVKAKDPENDALTYVWSIGNTTVETKEPAFKYTIKQPGEYVVHVEVKDGKLSSKSNEISVFAGNEQPQVNIVLKGNRTFYFTGKPLAYEVKVIDNGDKVDNSNLFVSTDFAQGNEDLAAEGHQVVSEEILGKNLAMSGDCKSCHKVAEKSVGPAFAQVAQRYSKDAKASSYLIDKIIKGGSGKWGEVAMPAHPNMKEGDVKQIVTWVLSLANTAPKNKSLPAEGTVTPKLQIANKQNTAFVLNASYTDAGGAGVRPLTGTDKIILRNNSIDASQVKNQVGFTTKDSSGNTYLMFPTKTGSLAMQKIDLSGIKNIELTGFGNGNAAKYTVEIRTDKADGNLIGQSTIAFDANRQKTSLVIPVKQSATLVMYDIFIVVKAVNENHGAQPFLKTIRFNQ